MRFQKLFPMEVICIFLIAANMIIVAHGRQLTNNVLDGYPGYPITINYDSQIGPGTEASLPFNDTRLVCCYSPKSSTALSQRTLHAGSQSH